ncbi:SPOSA6832_03125 [Sporobolomyces salmonicolor]|uniref:SPOSA6832_03125-mRNA-1:cds n=1 Tax=Sporidiobolus salmonicolor TaxID=5005 RepID=A0A0D6EN48_SPOSA|nr:SPOSA6832_03125 [Sporobolomyces salmonicolor]
MPVELLPFPPSYCIVGAYRLATDPNLYRPIWKRSSRSLKRALVLAIPYAILAFPLTRLYVTFILSRSPLSPRNIHDAALLGVSPVKYTTWALVLGQVSMLVEWLLGRELKKSREEVYEQTVRSRGKDSDDSRRGQCADPCPRSASDFWQPYVEEWAVPPIDRAKRSSERQSFYVRLASPLVRIVLLRVLLTPLSFIPGLSLCVISALRSLTLARYLHKPYFAAKKMTPFQTDLWIVERQAEYRLFGFVASLLERIPLFGLIFSISNRIGSAMWAFDLEKQQHRYSSGELKPAKVYESKTAALAEMQEAADLPDEVLHGIGGFPAHKGPVRIEKDGSEVGLPQGPPALPPR